MSARGKTWRGAAPGTGMHELFEIASGGMGLVRLALRVEGSFRRFYAVKRLHAHLRSDPEFESMFLHEARVAGLVRHPNVVSVLDVGEDAEGPFLVMEYVDGVSLGTLMREASRADGRLPLQATLRIAIEIARGLEAVHEATSADGAPLGLVHRDLSPQNVLVSHTGSVHITDFGIAKALDQSPKTATGMLKGKLGYMAPEQLMHGEIDSRTDLFSFGVILFELATGDRLYDPRAGRSAARVLHDPPPDLTDSVPDAPPELVELLFELLAKEPNERPESARHVALRLEAMLAETLASEPPIDLRAPATALTAAHRAERRARIDEALTLLGQRSRGGRRRTVVAAAIASAFALVLAAGTYFVASSTTSDTPPPSANEQARVTAPASPEAAETSTPEPSVAPIERPHVTAEVERAPSESPARVVRPERREPSRARTSARARGATAPRTEEAAPTMMGGLDLVDWNDG